jgi:hypothetical protein
MSKKLQIQRRDPNLAVRIKQLENENAALRRDFHRLLLDSRQNQLKSAYDIGEMMAYLGHFQATLREIFIIVQISDGQVRDQAIQAKNGQVLAAAKKYIDLYRRITNCGPNLPLDALEIRDQALKVEAAISTAIEKGDYTPLKSLISDPDLPIETSRVFARQTAGLVIRGNRPQSERVLLLGQLWMEIHPSGSERFRSARIAVQRLEEMSSEYEWAAKDAEKLRQLIEECDSEGIGKFFQYPVQAAKKKLP